METHDILALGRALTARGWRLATAESCTGGLVGHLATSVSGSSDWYLGGVVAYVNAVKERLLGVPDGVLAAHGAVSRETVRAMAAGARERLGAEMAVALSGVAGPTGGTPETPVGTVWIAWSWPGGEEQELFRFAGDRAGVKAQAANAALRGALARALDAVPKSRAARER